jgi:glycerol-3-phosphate dehydrogenase
LDRIFDLAIMEAHQRLRHRARCGGPATFPCEMNDLASGRRPGRPLVHGGLRYLEYYEFRLVTRR